ncbi:MAG: methylglyoxal synthase [Cellvibrionaceae bacterium]
MKKKKIASPAKKNIALVAHDNCKAVLINWCEKNKHNLSKHHLFATGTTGARIEKVTKINITKLLSGPLGGDQQIGAKISEGKIDMLIFFWDPFEPMPHDPDIKALLRIATAWNIPVACNQSSADMIVNSNLFTEEYIRDIPDYDEYLSERK